VRANVAVIVTGGYRLILAARDATRSIPIVVWSCDPLETLVESLARPGGNVTGSTCLSAELSPKKLQLLKETVPSAAQIAVLFNPDDPGPRLGMKLMSEAARGLRIKTRTHGRRCRSRPCDTRAGAPRCAPRLSGVCHRTKQGQDP
jgi:putative ABC transport system substrate-binding protein